MAILPPREHQQRLGPDNIRVLDHTTPEARSMPELFSYVGQYIPKPV